MSDKVSFPLISNKAYGHPLDLSAYEIMSKVPLVPDLFKTVNKYLIETGVEVELMSETVRVSPKQYPRIYELLHDACQIIDISPPATYVKQTPVVNAYTTGIHRPVIVLYSGLLDLLTDEEIQAIIGHELGHIKAQHFLYIMALSLAVSNGYDLFIDMLPNQLKLPFAKGLGLAVGSWLRKCELTADRVALLVCQNPKIYVSALMKMAGGTFNYGKHDAQLSVDEFLIQGKELESIIKTSEIKMIHFLLKSIGSHPLHAPRASIAYQWGTSEDYKNIVDGKYAKIKSKKCPTCSKSISDINYSCPYCLSKFGDPDYSKVFTCSACETLIDSTKLDPDAKFCPKCGEPLAGSSVLVSKIVNVI